MLDQAFAALKTIDWGTDLGPLRPIDEALISGDAAERGELEARLAAVLKTGVSRAAKDFVCRKLMVIGTAASVPALAALLTEKDHSHMARYAFGADWRGGSSRGAPRRAAQARRRLENRCDRIAGRPPRRGQRPLAGRAARRCRHGRRLLRRAGAGRDPDRRGVASTGEGQAVERAGQAGRYRQRASAEGLLAAGKPAEAEAVYRAYAGTDQPKHVRLAATRGMLACAGTKQ